MKAKVWRLLLSFCLIFSLFSFTIKPSKAQTENAADALSSMTPAEKVGQLFLVTFDGSTAADNSEIYRLITDYHLGGVVLNSEHDNFTDEISDTWQLISNLQEINWQKNSERGTYVPLYVGMSLVSNDNHTAQLLNGLSDILPRCPWSQLVNRNCPGSWRTGWAGINSPWCELVFRSFFGCRRQQKYCCG